MIRAGEKLSNGFFIIAHALNYKLTRRRIPLMVSIGLTDRCNLKCPFCYAKSDRPGYVEYTTDELLGFVDSFVKLGTRIFLLQGGEPLLRDDIDQVIRRIKVHGRYCRISTNGVLAARRIEKLRGLDQISFSLDGNEEVCDSIRGKGVYREVREGLQAAFEAKIPFEIHASLIRQSASNRDSLYHLLDLAKKYRTYVSFCVTSVSGAENTKEVGGGEMSPSEVKELYSFLLSLKGEGYPVSNTKNSLRKTPGWPISFSLVGYRHNLPPSFKFTECRHGKLVCWLDGRRTLYPCPSMFLRKEYSAEVKGGDIASAWKELGGKIDCIACGGSDESTTFFALKLEDIFEVTLRVLRG